MTVPVTKVSFVTYVSGFPPSLRPGGLIKGGITVSDLRKFVGNSLGIRWKFVGNVQLIADDFPEFEELVLIFQ